MGKSKNKEIPSRADLVDYNHAVAGHAGTLCDADGELFIKPCTQAEIDFYQSANRRHPDFADLMPLFLGTLMLNEQAELSSIEDGVAGPIATPAISEQLAQAVATLGENAQSDAKDTVTWIPNKTKKIKTDQAVVLENASSAFYRPNILDVKLGVRLWADDAPLEKKRRFDKITSETTHGPLGFRIAGMRVYQGSPVKADLDQEGYKKYDKDYGRVSVNTDNVVDSFRKFIFNDTAGVDTELGQAVAQAFLRDLRHVEKVLSSHESRMYSSSLLFVFEGDGQKLRDAIEENNATADSEKRGEKPARNALRVDSGIELMEDEDDDDDSDDGSMLPRIYALKLIDFAHAQWTPGLGPDENTLTGVRSLIHIFEQLSS